MALGERPFCPQQYELEDQQRNNKRKYLAQETKGPQVAVVEKGTAATVAVACRAVQPLNKAGLTAQTQQQQYGLN